AVGAYHRHPFGGSDLVPGVLAPVGCSRDVYVVAHRSALLVLVRSVRARGAVFADHVVLLALVAGRRAVGRIRRVGLGGLALGALALLLGALFALEALAQSLLEGVVAAGHGRCSRRMGSRPQISGRRDREAR